jgi:hypothetical protein
MTAAPESTTTTRRGPVVDPAPHVKTRWNRRLLLIGILLALLCGLAAYWAVNRASTPRSVVVVTKDIAAGDVITEDALGTTLVTGGENLTTTPEGQLRDLVGERASVPMPAGSLATKAMTIPRISPREGQAIVGVALSPGQYPTSGLQRGDAVRLVVTGGGQSIKELPPGKAFTATVLAVGDVDNNGRRTVDLSIGTSDADLAAAAAGTEKVAIVNVLPVGLSPDNGQG